MRSSGLLFGLVVATLVSFASTTPLKYDQSLPAERPEIVYRLPTHVIPNHYDITLVPYLTDGHFNFSGQVVINVNVTIPTNVITLHSHNLRILASATTVSSEAAVFPISAQTYDSLTHFYTLVIDGNLTVGEYNVTISFSGDLTTDMTGFYRSSYQVGNDTRWLATTQFQPTSARRAFPCFDEPGLKATFNVRIAHFENQIALSNMPNVSTSDADNTIDGRVWTQFETTPVMSTYILAFVVSDFGQVTSTDEFFAVWSRNQALNTTAFALESTEILYPIFLDTLQTPDPWPKIDQVAVPDFSAGAMENWGLITYRERLLLWQQGESSSRAKELISSIISHELAHIWFGNLVSPSWWDHLWFSEGFASLYEYLIPSLAYPEWRFSERIVTDQQLGVLISDSLETTRPMMNVVGSPASIMASFDNVAYAKSSAVFRMLSRVMREDLFSRALANFLEESAHGIFVPANLWAHMQIIADANTAVQNHIPIASIMDSWVTQPGYPLVTVSRNYSTMVVVFSQERYFMDPNSPTADPEHQRWWIPITFTTGVNATACNNVFMQPDWLRAQDKSIMASNIQNTTWILVHCQGTGLYRVNYDTRNWELLTEFLKGPNFPQINPVNRAILIDDSFNLARSGYIDYSIPLDLSGYLAQETDFVVWRSTIPLLTYLNTILASDSYFPFWQAYQRSLISDLYESLGWVPVATDTHEVRMQRQQILNLACQLDQPGARTSAEVQFNQWITNPTKNPVDPDLKSVVYCWGVRDASEATWNVMWNRFLTTYLATEEDVLLRSLACIKNSTILERYLQLSITLNSGIRTQDTFTVFTSILTSEWDNIDLLLDFVAENAQAISEFYGGFNGITSMLTGIAGRITRQDQLEKFRVVANSDDLGASDVAIERAIQTATANLYWVMNNAPAIQEWLQDEGLVPETTSTEILETTTVEVLETTTEEIPHTTLPVTTPVPIITTIPTTTPIATTTTIPATTPIPTTTPIPITTTEPTTTPIATTTNEPTTTPITTTPIATTPIVTTTDDPTTTPDSGATAFTSSLLIIFTSVMLCMINY